MSFNFKNFNLNYLNMRQTFRKKNQLSELGIAVQCCNFAIIINNCKKFPHIILSSCLIVLCLSLVRSVLCFLIWIYMMRLTLWCLSSVLEENCLSVFVKKKLFRRFLRVDKFPKSLRTAILLRFLKVLHLRLRQITAI